MSYTCQLPADSLRGMLLLRRVEQEKQVHEEEERLQRLKAHPGDFS
jgi:hypothetical protein